MTDASDLLVKFIAQRNTKAILREMFSTAPVAVQYGYFKEDELWDYKEDLPPIAKGHENAWARIASDVLAFHNNRGGIIIFGIRNKDFSFVGATQRVDTKLFNDKIRKYVGDRFWVSFSREYIQEDQRYLGIAIVPPKEHAPLRVMGDSLLVNGKRALQTGDFCIRVGDETRILRGSEAEQFAARNRIGTSTSIYQVEEPNFRVLRPDWRRFIYRKSLCVALESALYSDRTFVTSLTGIGGVGKTALASWATLQAYEKRRFDFIVSLTAKDRALTSTGIIPFTPTLSSLTDLLKEICDTTGFNELLDDSPVEKQLESVKSNILSQFRGLLLVDNLETVDDQRIIQFLENLPLPTRAIVTSRKTRVRVACQPIEVGSFENDEAIEFLENCARITGRHSIAEMSKAEKLKIVNCCDRIPLVIEWYIGKAKSAEKALMDAESLASQSKHGEELVEFCFRRVYGELTERQQSILKVLSLIGRPLPMEAISAGANLPIHEVADELEELRNYSLLERQYDVSYRDVVQSLLPVTNTFVYRELSKTAGYEATVRKRLNDWYQAKEVVDLVQRMLVQKIRRGERNPELALLEVATNFLKTGDLANAEHFYKLGLERNPRSWQLHRELAEFYRHHRREISLSLQHYEQASEHAPKQGPERAKIFREHGMVLRDSGVASAHREAAIQLAEALKEMPQDVVCRHALGDCHVKIGAYKVALEVLKPLEDHHRKDTRIKTYPLLEECYKHLNDMLGLAQLKSKMSNDDVKQQTREGTAQKPRKV